MDFFIFDFEVLLNSLFQMRLIYFLLFFIFFTSCQDDPSTKIQAPKSILVEPVEPVEQVEFIVYINNLRLRSGPGVDHEVITSLPENAIVKYKGESSMHSTRVKMRGMDMNARWLLIKTEDGQEGWIYGGGIKPKTTNEKEATKIVDDINLYGLFETKTVLKIKDYKNQWNTAQTSSDFAATYLLGAKIQEEINEVLSKKVQIEDPMNLPDMEWLERVMVGYQNSLAAEGTMFHLFQNYKKMQIKTLQTEGKDDDDFIELQFKVNEIDSIEHFYKSWFIQTWDYGGHSLLGQGKHYALLSEMNSILSKSKLFEKPILKIKSEIIKDILDEHITYWESRDKILDEVGNIINANFVFLSKTDVIGLKAKSKQFENPKANKIEINKRQGD